VLLVDADLRRPTVADHLGLRQEGERGLTSVILDAKLSLEHVIQRESHVNMTIVTAGPRLSAPFEALKSQRLVELFAEARQRYEYIVVDTPPVVHVPDCQVISQYVDGFLMVVAAHATPRKLLEEALNTMDPAKMVGLVFNGDNRPLSGYYAHYYHATRAGAGQSERWQSAAKRVGAALRGRSRNGLEDGDAP
jgi:capsular exopolysaccharide synthesis family protein